MSAPVYKVDGLGSRMKELREKKGYKQDDVSKMTGIGRSSISSYEIGMETPTYANLIKIAMVLNASTDYLLGYESDRYIDLTGIDESKKQHIYELYNMFMDSEVQVWQPRM